MDPYTPPKLPEPILVSIGDIHCTATQVITPTGAFPIAGSQWAYTDQSSTTRGVPTWAVVLAVAGFFLVCALSLLFLLAKEEKTYGQVQVTVFGPGGQSYTTTVPVQSAFAVQDTVGRVNYARSLAGLPG